MSSTNSQYTAPVDFRISQTPPDDIPPEYRTTFTQLYNSIQQIIRTFTNNCGIAMQPSNLWDGLDGSSSTLLAGNLNRFYVTASEDLEYGVAISLTQEDPVRAKLATAGGVPAHGFCTTPGGIVNGAVGEVQLHSGVVNISGLLPGASYFLSTTTGLVSPTPPASPGLISQFLGVAINSTTLFFFIEGKGEGDVIDKERLLSTPVSEDVVYGAAVNFFDNSGTLTARNANATNNTKPAQGFCATAGGVTAGNTGAMQIINGTVGISGLTRGSSYFLSTTDGLISNAPAAAAGNITQYVGFAISDSLLAFNLTAWLQH
jgi:hypothetical protein